MKVPKSDNKDFEKLVIDEWLTGTIEDIQYDMEKKWTWEGKETVQPGVRFVFSVDQFGDIVYKFHHYSGWLKLNVGEKANLYKRYVSALVVDAKPNMEIDIDVLKGMKVKFMWEESESGFQRVLKIKPVGKKVRADSVIHNPEDEFTAEIEEVFETVL
jgi:hypothetical protein